jgi:hypothetical protein
VTNIKGNTQHLIARIKRSPGKAIHAITWKISILMKKKRMREIANKIEQRSEKVRWKHLVINQCNQAKGKEIHSERSIKNQILPQEGHLAHLVPLQGKHR